jgi:iron complex outermembrane receptor protein
MMTTNHSSRFLVSSAVVAALGYGTLPQAARAQSADTGDNVIQEVVVTAERRTEDIQKAPLAVTAISADTLDKSNITDPSGLNGYVPSLNVTRSGGFETVVTIRGVGSQTPENQPATGPGVSLYVDGVYIADDIAADQGFFDVDNVEVLRGPQGALYGVSSTGGAINIVSKQPVLGAWHGGGEVSAGDYNFHRERADLNIPIGDTIAVRFAGQKVDHDGYTINTLAPGYKLDDQHDTTSKAQVKWQPSDNFSATLTGQWYVAQDNGQAQKSLADPNSDPRVLTQDFLGKFELYTQLYHLNLKWDTPWLSVSSVSAYQGLQNYQAFNATFTTFAAFPNYYDDIPEFDTKVKSYSEEFDLLSPEDSKLKWIAGIFWERSTTDTFVIEYEGATANPVLTVPSDVEAHPPSNLAYGNSTDDVRTSIEPFFQATYPITDRFRTTIGGRYNYESHDHYNLNFNEFGANSINMASTVNNKFTTHEPTWRAEAEYDVTPDSLAYVSFSRGYKPGGVNGNPLTALVPLTFKPETNIAYEIGSKNLFFDRSLRANVAGFYYDYQNMQYIETDPIPFDQGMANIPSIHIYGGEAEVSYLGMQNRLHINGNLTVESGSVQGYTPTLDSTTVAPFYANQLTGPCAFGGQYYSPTCWSAILANPKNIQGNQPPDMPRVSGSVNASYDLKIPTGTLTPRLDYVYRGSLWSRIFNEPVIDRVGAYFLVNANLSYQPDNSNFVVTLSGTNLTNIAGVNSRYTSPYEAGVTSQEFVPPRLFFGSVSYHF